MSGDLIFQHPVLKWFQEITKIPRCSGSEKLILDWLKSLADRYAWQYRQDPIGNLVLIVPASDGFEERPKMILQAHVDMVCDKEFGCEHDFSRDPINIILNGDWLTADRTTLGADNGAGVALMLAIATDAEVLHPELELLFTVKEEVGLQGVEALSDDMLTGRYCLNFDSEAEGVLTLGCAGAQLLTAKTVFLYEQSPANMTTFEIRVHGLKSGHSGLDIHRNRANALKLLAESLLEISTIQDFRLVDLGGGGTHNVIPKEARAIVVVPSSSRAIVEDKLRDKKLIFSQQWAKTDPDLQLDVVYTQSTVEVMSRQDTERFICFLNTWPHGVDKMSRETPGFVLSSNNLASVKIENQHLILFSSQRAGYKDCLYDLCERLVTLAKLAGFQIEKGHGYLPWQPLSRDDPFISAAIKAFKRLFQKEPKLNVYHAGLECASIAKKYLGMKILSSGFTIHHVHTPNERLYIPSVDKMYRFAIELLQMKLPS